MEVVFVVLMSFLPFQLLGAWAYHWNHQRGSRRAQTIGFLIPAVTFGLALGAWVLWVASQLSPQAEEWFTVFFTGIFLLPMGMVANLGCSLIVFLVRRNATQLPAMKPLQLS